MAENDTTPEPPQHPRPRTVTAWHQTWIDERIPIYGTNRWTQPDRGYIVGRLEKDGEIWAFAGPYRSDHELLEALRAFDVRPAEETAA
jgi:hypothetical protein